MGKVIVQNVVLTNHMDENLADAGHINRKAIPSITVDMIADSGALAVSLPQSLIDKLGLPFHREGEVTLADGSRQQVNIYRDLTVKIDDREAYTQCIGKNEHAPLLLGQLVFEQIDYIMDCKNQIVLPNPESTPGMISYAMFSQTRNST